MENFTTGVADKKTNIQTRANSSFNVDQGNFLANYTVRLHFELYV